MGPLYSAFGVGSKERLRLMPTPSEMAYETPENGKNKLLGTMPVTRKDAPILAKIDT
jgi:hypothetical protein